MNLTDRRRGRLRHDQQVSLTPDDVDRRRVRTGLAIVSVVFLVALVLVVVLDDAIGRGFMAAVLFISLVQAAMLVRKIRNLRG
jgi:hypothetical protein